MDILEEDLPSNFIDLAPEWRAKINVWVKDIASDSQYPSDALEYMNQIVYLTDVRITTLQRNVRYVDPMYVVPDPVWKALRAHVCSAVYDEHLASGVRQHAFEIPPCNLHNLRGVKLRHVHDLLVEYVSHWFMCSHLPYLCYSKYYIKLLLKDMMS